MINSTENKPIILCLVGRSGCGKTTASLWIQKHFSDINTIVSHTTRPIRYGETDGVEHWFAKDHRKDIPPISKMLAYTKFGGYEYWAELSDIKQDKINIYVIDEKGVNGLMKDYGDKLKIFICQIVRPGKDGANAERLDRDKNREPLKIQYPHWFIYNNRTQEILFLKMSEIVTNLIVYKLEPNPEDDKRNILSWNNHFSIEDKLKWMRDTMSPEEFKCQYMGNFEKEEDEKESRRDSNCQ